MHKVFVLDDDPTGTQAVHDVPVRTTWDTDALAMELAGSAPACFLLTNARALPEADAVALYRRIGANLRAAGARAGVPFAAVSRSDSTLRGHFPAEVDALAAGLGLTDAPILLCPYFEAGGRVTIDDTHYLRDGQRLIPVGQTEFARDATFGYRSSNLREWVEEKSDGRIPAAAVASVTLATIREKGPEAVAAQLTGLAPRQVCVLNCETPADLAALVAGVRLAAARREFLYRSAASFAAGLAGLTLRAPLAAADLPLGPGGVLVIAGSYVDKTTAQLRALLDRGIALGIEIDVAALLGDRRVAEVQRVAVAADAALRRGEDVVVYTSRTRVQAGELAAGQRISDALAAIVSQLTTRPRALIGKGGITSSDLATAALGIERAWVLGQIAPGVPVWKTGPETRWPDLAYIVFPGNVGDPETLAEVVATAAENP